MANIKLSLFFSFIFLAIACSESLVVTIGEQNFTEIIQDNCVFVEFYAPWCGFCQQFAETWEELAKIANKESIPCKIAKVDVTQNSGLASQFEVKGVPTLKYLREGTFRTYKGERDISNLKGFLLDGWKETKDEGKIPSKLPNWSKYQIDIYNHLMETLVKLEEFSIEHVHSDPQIAGIIIGVAGTSILCITLFAILSILSPSKKKEKRE